jgi:PIN domain nuclease of toxin-antitoxin system
MIVVDTCVVIWLASDPSLLSGAATDAIRTARKNGGVGISCIPVCIGVAGQESANRAKNFA